MEGIETSFDERVIETGIGISRCPDMEGIETFRPFRKLYTTLRISRCPDMEGIETSQFRRLRHLQFSISRCPDMEGIETPRGFREVPITSVSVGAPTWRGLKLLPHADHGDVIVYQ